MTTFANPFYYIGDRSQPWDAPAVLSGLSAQLDKMTNSILKILFLNFFIFLPLSACKAEEAQTLQSLPFLAVDLNGNGKIDTIPLEESEVYFDVDGDGLAERTEWISPEDGFLGVLSREEDLRVNNSEKRLLTALIGGSKKLASFDLNGDHLYSEEDKLEGSKDFFYWPATLSFLRDERSTGVLKSFYLKKLCEFKDITFFKSVNNMAFDAEIDCENNAPRKVSDIRFQYEDSDVFWKSLCHSLKQNIGAREEYQTRCESKGFVLEQGE